MPSNPEPQTDETGETLPHPTKVFGLWVENDTSRLDEMVARRHALLRREAEQEATR